MGLYRFVFQERVPELFKAKEMPIENDVYPSSGLSKRKTSLAI